jgi:hypothetical protein
MSAARALLPGAVPVIVLAGSLLAVPVLLAPEQASAAGSTMSSSSAGSARATHSRTLPVPSKREARLASRNQRPLADTEAAAEEATDGPDKDIALKAVSSAGGPAHPVRVFIMGRNGTAVAYEVRREQWLLTGPPVDWVPLYEGNDPHALQRALDTRLHRISKIKTGDGVIPPGWSRLFPKSPNTASQGPTSPVSPLRPLRGGFSELKQLVQDKRGTFVVVGPGEGASDSDVFFLYRYPNKDLVGVYTPDGRREWFRDTDEG